MGADSLPGLNIAVVRLSSFGDIVLTEPVTRAVKNRHPLCRITFVTNSDYVTIPSLFSSVDEAVPYSREGNNRALGDLAGGANFDLVLDLQNNLRSRRIIGGLKATRILRHRRPRFLRLLRVHLPWIWKGNLKPAVETYFDAIAPLCVEPANRTPVIEPPGPVVDRARRYLGDKPHIAVCPGGSSEHKRWSDARFSELVAALRSRGHMVAVIGSELDRVVVGEAAGPDGDGAVKTYVGNDIELIAGLLSICPVTVANDSGLMHLGAAVGSRVASIFGPTSPALGFAPTAGGCRVITLNLDCSPCSYHGTRPCRLGTRECLDEITAARVADIVEEMLT